MVQLIGLIVAVYAIARLAQVPIEMTTTKAVLMGSSLSQRFVIVAGISAVAVMVIGVLTLLLLASGSSPSDL